MGIRTPPTHTWLGAAVPTALSRCGLCPHLCAHTPPTGLDPAVPPPPFGSRCALHPALPPSLGPDVGAPPPFGPAVAPSSSASQFGSRCAPTGLDIAVPPDPDMPPPPGLDPAVPLDPAVAPLFGGFQLCPPVLDQLRAPPLDPAVHLSPAVPPCLNPAVPTSLSRYTPVLIQLCPHWDTAVPQSSCAPPVGLCPNPATPPGWDPAVPHSSCAPAQ